MKFGSPDKMEVKALARYTDADCLNCHCSHVSKVSFLYERCSAISNHGVFVTYVDMSLCAFFLYNSNVYTLSQVL